MLCCKIAYILKYLKILFGPTQDCKMYNAYLLLLYCSIKINMEQLSWEERQGWCLDLVSFSLCSLPNDVIQLHRFKWHLYDDSSQCLQTKPFP